MDVFFGFLEAVTIGDPDPDSNRDAGVAFQLDYYLQVK
jgi:hypothetical protein